MGLRDIFLRNRWQKAFSLLLATLIWFAVQSDSGLTSGFTATSAATRSFPDIPVEVLTGPLDRGRYRLTPGAVEVVLSGDSVQLRRVQPADIEAYVNVARGVPPGGQALTLHVHAPSGMKLAWVTPAEVTVRLADVPTGRANP